jgi:hypothetical protein
MANREKGSTSNFDARGDSAPKYKTVDGQLYEKISVPFGPGYTYMPVEAVSLPPATSSLMSERFSAAIRPAQEIIKQNTETEIASDDNVEQLERALRGHDIEGQELIVRLEEARLAREHKARLAQEEADRLAYRETIGMRSRTQSSSSRGYVDEPSFTNAEMYSDAMPVGQQDNLVERRKVPRALKASLAGVAILGITAGGVTLTAPNAPGEIVAGFLNQGQSSEGKEVKDMLPLPSAALVDAFGSCLSESGQGQSLIKLSVTSQTEVNRTYTSSKNVAKILETNFTDENGALLKANVKPVIITPNAPTAVTACVVEADRGSVITTEGNTVTVDLSKVSPQLYQDIALDQVVRGFPSLDTITDPKKDLWPVPTIIAGNVEAGKAKPATDEKMTPEIAASILKDFNDPTTIAAEIRQSQVKTAQALIRPGGGYAEKIKVYLKEGIIAKIKAKAEELKKQGLTDVESPNIVFTAEAKDIVEKNPEPPKAESFKLADTTQITGFSLQPAPEVVAKK